MGAHPPNQMTCIQQGGHSPRKAHAPTRLPVHKVPQDSFCCFYRLTNAATPLILNLFSLPIKLQVVHLFKTALIRQGLFVFSIFTGVPSIFLLHKAGAGLKKERSL